MKFKSIECAPQLFLRRFTGPILALALLTACGGSGSDSDPSDTIVPPSDDPGAVVTPTGSETESVDAASRSIEFTLVTTCLLYTSDAADE